MEEHYDYIEEPKKRQRKKKKDPNAPKRPQSSFFLYSNAMRDSVKESNPDASFGQIAKILSAQFKEISESERAEWDRKASLDRERYQREMVDYVPPEDDSDEDGFGKKKKKKKDPNAPKRNMSAFFLYSNEVRNRVKEENPGIKFGDVAKIISKEFKELDEAERNKWNDAALQDKERYLREKEIYEAGL